ncbi:type I-C CRISPR-associated protein Cas7/Csd2 [uncultured Cloacibacillus sp.]|uniref:type I-C CRISPR-associated protein Cas7/Csd2 n=1 Tax=uncultured Cloacibacillus sp. TaxID=889794 RepID=UPI002601A3E5|nr:type I-C CRISPR-associated protein Cas7/Csd2 [uncultured Cloacibacillus sp.]
MPLSNKIDFAVIFTVKNANPNGDPLDGNRPRIGYDGIGEVSDVCIKRKMRDRLLEDGQGIFVQSDDRKRDEFTSLKARAESVIDKKMTKQEIIKAACAKWFDVRAFGQLFAFKSSKKDDADGVSIGIRGPVSIHSAFSVAPINVTSIQITKSVNSEDTKDGKKSSDTMGMKHRVDCGTYVFYGSMNPQLAELTGFSDDDAEEIKKILPKLFENDASSARPEGSMSVKTIFWWKHSCKGGQYSSARVHGSLSVNEDGSYALAPLDGLEPEIIEGF